MTTATAPLTAGEIAKLNTDIVRRLKLRDRGPSAEMAPQPAAGARKPLGLRIVDDGAPHETSADRPAAPSASPAPADSSSGEPTLMDVMVTLTEFAQIVGEQQTRVQAKFDEIRAQFENKVAALKNENQSLRLILENLRITQRGERGNDGDRGPPGQDGRDGSVGPPGPKGSRGQRGFETTGWLINEAEYCITPLFYDNSQGPTLNLRGLFEQFNRDTEADDVAFATEQAGLSRARIELEVERTRLGLPRK